MANKYENLVEQINMQEEIVEKKENVTEQLNQVTQDVETMKGIVTQLVQAKDDLLKIANAVTAAGKSTDNSVTAITQAILDSRKVVFTNKLDDESITQLQIKYGEYSKKEDEMLKQHFKKIGDALDQNEKRCYEIISKGDGVYFGRKTFIRLCTVFFISFGIIIAEIVLGVLKLFVL